MCLICDEWNSQKIDSKKAFEEIGKVLSFNKDKKITDHLMDLSDKILNKEVPEFKIDKSLEKQWWNEINKGE